ncbi:DUF1854 domain-containing protein [Noviherbaspirillum saxi]|uniref:DUF1854 domain-containing protein n=1 Tax=Noviherbaspirillum saxi TaxID=2320863 RepID=A0A3A3FT10_9BURK|nr:DUF1854 domain-containing protein [Noviherbaspirillum saxi]RJF97331.1 DUF1854 domain-containing protein [Noviherbaspirillum saxi]
MTTFTLSRNAFGKLVFTSADGVHEGVLPVRAFPIAAPDKGIALVDRDGHELAWIERLDELPAATRTLLEEELKSREFLPVIKAIRYVSTFAVPSIWDVETDKGDTRFVLKGEEDIRRVAATTLLIADNHGVQYLIRNTEALDRASKKLLDRFL